MFKSYLRTYVATVLLAVSIIGIFNFMIDPLWYSGGNRLTGINYVWNERISKTNLLLRSQPQDYDCLLLGTSRSTLFDTHALTENRCFNYSFSGGKVEEFINYASYAKQKGFNPGKIYVEIDPRSFDQKSEPQVFSPVTDPMPAYRAYLFSWGALQLSFKSLSGDDSINRAYDQQFVGRLAEDAPEYEPEFELDADRNICDPQRIDLYRDLQQVFPDAEWIGFIAPVSAWFLYNERYQTGLLNCQLASVYEVASFFQRMYDFSVPSNLTTRTDNTYDGNHYLPRVYDRIAQVLEQKQDSPGIDVKQYQLADYQTLYATRLQNFLAEVGQPQLWRG